MNNYDRIIIEKLAHFKDLLLIKSVVSLLKTSEQKQEMIEWLDIHEDCQKTEVDEAVIRIVFK